MRTMGVVLAALTAVALGACSPPTSNPPISTPTPVPSTAAQRICHARDLGAVAGEAGAASGGETGLRFVFANHSSTPCTLQGIPAIQLLDGRGMVIPTTADTVSGDSLPVIVLASGHVPPASLPPAYKDPSANQARPGEAEMLLGWHVGNVQPDICGSPVTPAAMIEVHLPGNAGILLVKVPSDFPVAPCAGRLQLYPFATGPV